MDVICLLLGAYQIVLLARVIFSWVPRPPEPLLPVVRGVTALTEPLLAPIRRVLPSVPVGGVALDLSVIILFFAIAILQQAVC